MGLNLLVFGFFRLLLFFYSELKCGQRQAVTSLERMPMIVLFLNTVKTRYKRQRLQNEW